MTATQNIPQPFSNVQLELLKLFAENVSEADLLELKDLISLYFLEKAKDRADEIWAEKGWDSHELLKKHRRATKNKPHESRS